MFHSKRKKEIDKHDKSNFKVLQLETHGSVSVRRQVRGNTEWIVGTVVRRLGSLKYLLRVG